MIVIRRISMEAIDGRYLVSGSSVDHCDEDHSSVRQTDVLFHWRLWAAG
jgi:hypothetical protein